MSDNAPHEIEVDGIIYTRKSEMVEEIQSNDARRALVALRDYLVHELDGHRCDRCAMSQLKTGDTAALVLRLQKILEEIQAIPEVVTGPATGVTAIAEGHAAKMRKLKADTDAKKAAADNRRSNPPRRSTGRRT